MIDRQNLESVLEENGEISVCTSGMSMYPMLRHRRDTVVIKSIDGEISKNDVVVYRVKSGKLVLHRVLKITPDVFVIRGDNLYKKEYVNKQDVFGVLKGFFRNGRYTDCNTDKLYRLYIFYIKASYPVRYILFGVTRSVLKKVRSKIHSKSTQK